MAKVPYFERPEPTVFDLVENKYLFLAGAKMLDEAIALKEAGSLEKSKIEQPPKAPFEAKNSDAY